MSLAKEFRVGIAERELAFGQDCKALRPYEYVRPLVILHFLYERAPRIAKMVEFAAHGTGKLSTDRLMGLPFIIPPETLQQRFDSVAADIRHLVTRLIETSQNLRSTRDQLLPRLMSGQIDVDDIEIQLPTAA